jgi:type IV pilus assembly protein PilC
VNRAAELERLAVTRPKSGIHRNDGVGILWRLDRYITRRISEKDKAEFCTQLAVMLQARVSLHRALDVLARQTTQKGMKEVIEHLGKEVQKGSSFSRTLRTRASVFDELFVVSVEVGQESGRLPDVLSHLARHLEKMGALKRKILQAMTYPILVIAVACLAVTFLLVFIVPTFAEMFRSFQVELPWSTTVVLRMSTFLVEYGPWILVSLLTLSILLRRTLASPRVVRAMQNGVYRLPFFGELVLRNQVARFCRTLGTLLQSQVSLVDALEVTRRIATNDEIKNEIGEILKHVKLGKTVADPLIDSKLFPPLVAQMIAVGEETSELDGMLLKVSDYYEKELEAKVETLTSVIEPVIILLLGMLVAGILIAMYMPMFELVNVVGAGG